ncbi:MULTISPECIES: dihydroneopterin aldolase [Pasteurellaceae]|uniref:7,8-dihydroneopterin aldolase n=1 Tax=Pasteurella atlantica TaxID=2827233 RepID=A0AAW8CQQ8_9PAST|nr:dihydroneopterin aldolase [Pasteurella atlantica]MBR0573782.1 dihydroneopterin aldolase [Pasteurella atlantica]MDP8039718.1 dihydroneopterin aldolase [Pasteurella atlantica]MDP8041903.1 dihydroneopterin aldolase [Pasteurella atlantica]MDP8044072.1 dihydroneopterin aldolase [Pasteurella atlantica]MDP8046050.1 dihydroneopterin aldolase [Pasteurella atlantica]
MDIIFIKELTVSASVGVYEWEKNIKQPLVFNIEMVWNFEKAAQSDNVKDCLNYAEVSQEVINFVESQHFDLVETIAHRLAELLAVKFNIPWLKIELHKPQAVSQASSVGVIIERGSKVK